VCLAQEVRRRGRLKPRLGALRRHETDRRRLGYSRGSASMLRQCAERESHRRRAVVVPDRVRGFVAATPRRGHCAVHRYSTARPSPLAERSSPEPARTNAAAPESRPKPQRRQKPHALSWHCPARVGGLRGRRPFSRGFQPLGSPRSIAAIPRPPRIDHVRPTFRLVSCAPCAALARHPALADTCAVGLACWRRETLGRVRW
jgi:hypothetical protein